MAIKEMQARRTSLAEAIQGPAPTPLHPARAMPPAANESRDPEAVRSRQRAQKRREDNFATLNTWVPKEAKRQFDHLVIDLNAANGETTGSSLILEALNLLFRNHGLPPIARSET